jgi:UDP-glucose 6-dehydrogenase
MKYYVNTRERESGLNIFFSINILLLCLAGFLNSCKKTDEIVIISSTIVIGTQTWMAENLKVTRLNDGTDILFAPDATDWAALWVADTTSSSKIGGFSIRCLKD